MKRLLIAFLLLAVSFSVQAQNDYGGSGAFGQVVNGDGWLRPGGGNVRGGGNGSAGKNVIKIRLDGLYQAKFGLGYERVLNKKISVGLNGFYQLPQKNTSLSEDFGLLFETVIDNFSAEKETFQGIFPADYGFQGSEINKFFIMPEIRYYFKNAPRGFFAGLYFKYRSYDYQNNLIYTDTLSTPGTPINYDFDFNVQMNTASAGLSLGIQTFLLKRVSLDLILFGIQYSSNIGGIQITTRGDQLPDFVQNDVQAGVDYLNANLPIDDIFRLRENTPELINIESRFTSPSIRFPSIRLGIRF